MFTILYEEAAENDLRAFRAYEARRIADFRVFYDVDEDRQAVIVRAIRRKGAKTTGEIL